MVPISSATFETDISDTFAAIYAPISFNRLLSASKESDLIFQNISDRSVGISSKIPDSWRIWISLVPTLKPCSSLTKNLFLSLSITFPLRTSLTTSRYVSLELMVNHSVSRRPWDGSSKTRLTPLSAKNCFNFGQAVVTGSGTTNQFLDPSFCIRTSSRFSLE